MNTRFKVFASYNILQYLCDLIHVLIFVTVSKLPKKSQINEYSDIFYDSGELVKVEVTHKTCRLLRFAVQEG